ncbi:MAG: isocitrate/isopropylmalate family dehydrogenase, partial [Bryobacteraceae bacterium]
MTQFSVAVIPGDGIGREVVPAAIRVLEASAAAHRFDLQFEWFDWGSEYYFQHGSMMPADAL